MIHTNHIFVLSDQAFADRHLRELFCRSTTASDRQSCARGWGLGRRR